MAKPRVTVCIPVYNLENYIAETLDSLKAQTYQDYEAIIVNDGSKDSSEKVIAGYLDDPRFKYIYQENKGLAGARNTALAAAEGEWFAQLDGDDIWLPRKLELQIALADSDPKANMIYGNLIQFREDGWENVGYSDSEMPEGDITPNLYFSNFLCGSSLMVKTEELRALGGYPIQALGEDYTLWLRFARRGIWAKACKEPVVRYRIRANSLLSARLPNLRAQVVIMEEALSHEDRPHFARILRRGIERIKWAETYECARVAAKGGEGDIEKLLWEAWGHRRSDYRRLGMALVCTLSRLIHVRQGREFVARMLRNSRTNYEIAEQTPPASS